MATIFFKLYTILSIWYCISYGETKKTNEATSNIGFLDLEKGITKGVSLKDHRSVKELRPNEYDVECAGSIENYSKWPLKVQTTEYYSGEYVVWLRGVIKSGQVEGFSSQHDPLSATGVMMRHTMIIDDDILLHFMYSIPYDQNFYTNWLAIAACAVTNPNCRKMDAYKMYYRSYPFLSRKSFDHNLRHLGRCYDGICVAGWMEKGHTPIIRFQVLPRSFYDVSRAVREKLPNMTKKDYEDYMRRLFGLKY